MKKRILIAGIGNIFFGDDAFGVEAVRELSGFSERQPQVQVMDFGIRSYDLAYALTDGYEAIILVDALPRAGVPGTIYLIEPDLSKISQSESELPDAHSLNPVSVLKLAQSLGGIKAKVFLVGCEPGTLDSGCLSEPVRAALPQALEKIESLVCKLLAHRKEPTLQEQEHPVSAPNC